jgi:hypothetical protein
MGAGTWRAYVLALAAAVLAAGCGASHYQGRTIDYWIAAVPVLGHRPERPRCNHGREGVDG